MPPQKVKTCFHICLVEKKNETVGLPPPSPPPISGSRDYGGHIMI